MKSWIPACAGMTSKGGNDEKGLIRLSKFSGELGGAQRRITTRPFKYSPSGKLRVMG